jgi:tRNA modification GTPase
LIRFSALIELELDFSQEDVTFADRSALQALIAQIKKETDDLRQSFKLGNVIRNGVSVAIIGKPNAGKSTLLNALLNEERAIVSDIPGTTRDTIEEVLNIDGILFRLIDTAGIRRHSDDLIEAAGIQRSVQKMKESDLVLYVFDVHETTPEALASSIADLQHQASRYLLLGNKIDAVSEPDLQERFSAIADILFIGARDGAHLDVLKRKMLDTVLRDSNAQTENVIVTNARHYQALTEVTNALQEVLEGLAGGLPGDLLALDIRRCLHYLGEITGAITNEDQLDYIFSKFCIGK